MELTLEARSKIAELLGATGEFRVYYRDGKVERVPARSVVVDGERIVRATEGLAHDAGVIDEIRLYNESGEFVCGGLGTLHMGLGAVLELSSSSYSPP